jgi:hypothetical protein
MSRICRRFVVWAVSLCALVIGPLAMTTIIKPAVSWACDPGQVWDAAAQACVLPPPPPPPAPVPVTMCLGAPVPFVPMSWCFPVGGQ